MKPDSFSHGDILQIVNLSDTIPLHAQGGGKPRVGDTVKVGLDHYSVNTGGCFSEPWYWCIGKNDSGEYGAKFTHSDLNKVAE